ncbi:putative uncharacterized protein [Firmicutes bacterium CAG:646]|nr:putative uncharacterized protein [Firmicutes bacterium CAG:646]
MPDELFRAAHSHNSAPYSDIAGHTPHFYPHFGAGHKDIKPLLCKHNVVYDLLTLASKNLYMIEEEGVFSWEIRLRIKEKGM